MQTTLKAAVHFAGISLHKGCYAQVWVMPAPAHTGFVFERIDLPLPAARRTIRVCPDAWVESALCTSLANPWGVSVSTVEHLLAALAGCGVHNALIRLDGPEVPILDGSALPFVRAFHAVGLKPLDVPIRAIRVDKAVEVARGDARARLEPAPRLEISFAIDFPDTPAIGRQSKTLALCNGAFVHELASSRTFCRRGDVDTMRARGLALGGSYDNAIVVEGAKVLTPGGLRYKDEPVRHKMLDALGDLAVAGAPIVGHYVGLKAGHALTGTLVKALFAEQGAFSWVELRSEAAAVLPSLNVADTLNLAEYL